VFLEIVFRLEAKMTKLKAGCGAFLCQRAKAFPANMIVLLVPPWKLFCHRAPIWLCDPPALEFFLCDVLSLADDTGVMMGI
jgi:hypothetical protein